MTKVWEESQVGLTFDADPSFLATTGLGGVAFGTGICGAFCPLTSCLAAAKSKSILEITADENRTEI